LVFVEEVFQNDA
jgi:hypothetical protein